MIDKFNYTTVLEELNNALKKEKLSRNFTVFGSAALIIQNLAAEDQT